MKQVSQAKDPGISGPMAGVCLVWLSSTGPQAGVLGGVSEGAVMRSEKRSCRAGVPKLAESKVPLVS